ncbi:MAG TPA: PspC domain-containing protein [Thermoanaerobaculia bacterium]|jgi:phage shock protein C|nr:PspC domain-containing protein [Thermoanaerobaculia bacterium]
MTLERSRSDKIIAGVCGGIARRYGWDPMLVRIVYVLVSIFSAAFPGIIVYVVLWFLMPLEGTSPPPPAGVPPGA